MYTAGEKSHLKCPNVLTSILAHMETTIVLTYAMSGQGLMKVVKFSATIKKAAQITVLLILHR